jgi:hypothetical protein
MSNMNMPNLNVSVPLHVLQQLLQGRSIDSITGPLAVPTAGPNTGPATGPNTGPATGIATSISSTNRGGRGNASGRGSNRRPCQFYQRGNCRNGTNCGYLHAKTSSGKAPGREPCRHHMLYGCTHESKTGTPCMLPHPECPMIAQNGECAKDINCVQGCPTRSRAVYAQRQANIRAAAASSQPDAGQSGVE